MLMLMRNLHERQQEGRELHLRDLHKAGLRLPEDEWDDILGFFEQEQLVCRTGSGGWVLCRDLNHYSLDQLLRCNPGRSRRESNYRSSSMSPGTRHCAARSNCCSKNRPICSAAAWRTGCRRTVTKRQ